MIAFDEYAVKAHALPILFTATPAIVYAAGLSHQAGLGSAWIDGGVTAVALVGVSVLIAPRMSSRGKALEGNLFAKWGGMPTTRFLRPGDTTLPENVKLSVLRTLSDIAREPFPDLKLATTNPAKHDAQVERLVSIARELTRDASTYPRIAAALRDYGYARNLYAIRTEGLVLSTAVALLAFLSAGLEQRWSGQVNVLMWSAAAIAALWAVLWFVWVEEDSVRHAGDAYALALLQAIDAYSPVARR